MSNGILIPAKPTAAKPAEAAHAFDWEKGAPTFEGTICGTGGTKVQLDLVEPATEPDYKIDKTKQTPFKVSLDKSTLYVRWAALGKTGDAEAIKYVENKPGTVSWQSLADSLEKFVRENLSTLAQPEFEVTGECFLRFENWPYETLSPIKVQVKKSLVAPCDACCDASAKKDDKPKSDAETGKDSSGETSNGENKATPGPEVDGETLSEPKDNLGPTGNKTSSFGPRRIRHYIADQAEGRKKPN